jgi:hypothetical protein
MPHWAVGALHEEGPDGVRIDFHGYRPLQKRNRHDQPQVILNSNKDTLGSG